MICQRKKEIKQFFICCEAEIFYKTAGFTCIYTRLLGSNIQINTSENMPIPSFIKLLINLNSYREKRGL